MDLTNRFSDDGASELPAVLFLHAYPYQRAMWEPQRQTLRGRARVLTLDARGLGPSSHPPTAYLLEHLVDDALALLDQRHVQRCSLVGLSMGGYIALRLAQRAPDRVAGLLLANTQAAADGNEAKLARADALRLLWTQGKQVFADAQLKRQLSPHTHEQRPELVAHLREMIVQGSTEGLAASLVAIATRTDLSSFLPELRVPATVLVGEDDVITPPATARAMAQAIPGATLHVLPRAGHVSNLEAETAFNEQLLAFLGRGESAHR